MQRTPIVDIKDLVGQTVDVYGWVHTRRDHGKLIFIDIRDRSGMAQVVFSPAKISEGNLGGQAPQKSIHELASQLRSEWVIHLKGKINARPDKMVNADIPTGKVEIEPIELEILNKSETPPFPIDTNGLEIGEEHRMKYRYLDLRRERMAKNMVTRHKLIKFIRDYLDDNGFLEIETPILTKSTPEGARDYVVPSRLYSGSFYALPQSPQQYKQLLMVAGLEKYFQIARCFRRQNALSRKEDSRDSLSAIVISRGH